ncbi:hypothetical protein CLHOM_32400 [Clostridium homopropionicum DSM 5847]|uniref:Uncharacterized protein n=1 Tax=Clostridium homopropionicum DSM 5847 TaxID=1121318 RepID=A0A0L6Z5U8_9CLOT|nr:hypothetical protein [Clostridium homopropionicum]KOA18342.1 hypothetical protein CLHOM_32400 [Clostridium homopropionicum DSM 5847]SFF68848.1 hypothetical protein SAMN04488501_101241 [Clostridium homopropionicum]
MYLSVTEHSDSIDNIINEINQWSRGREKFLNIISPPYNVYEIFAKVIIDYIEENKSILYITNEESENINIIKSLKKENDFKNYTYFKINSKYCGIPVVICKHEMSNNISDKFDLVIYDDIKSFSFYSKEEIAKITIERCKSEGKIIAYSIERTFNYSKELLFPVRANYSPLAEPKIITTRIDINKDIPYVIYEYLEWIIRDERKVIVYVPSEEKVFNVYEYLAYYCSKFTNNIFYYIKGREDKAALYKFINKNKCILVTNHFKDISFNIENLNVMVFFADDGYFNYKNLVYLCGKVGRSSYSLRGEVIFLANYDTEHMDTAKDIIRYFNKQAWEMKLLKI